MNSEDTKALDMATVSVPNDPADYGRWLAGRVAAYAALVRRDERAELGDDARQMMLDAMAELQAALASQ